MPASFSPVWLCATSWTVAHQTPLSMGFFWSRILEWVTISSLRGSSQPTYRTWISCVSCTGKRVLYHCAIWEAPHRYPSHTDTPPSYILQYFSISSPQPIISFCLKWGPLLLLRALFWKQVPRSNPHFKGGDFMRLWILWEEAGILRSHLRDCLPRSTTDTYQIDSFIKHFYWLKQSSCFAVFGISSHTVSLLYLIL